MSHGDRHGGSKAERLGLSQCVPGLLQACVGTVASWVSVIPCSDAAELQTAGLEHGWTQLETCLCCRMRGRHVDDASAVSFRGFGRKFGTSQAALGKLVSSAKRPLSQHLSASDVWGLGLEGHPNADSHPSKPHAPPQCEPFEDAQTIAIVGEVALPQPLPQLNP